MMALLKEEYKKFLDDIEKNIKNPEDLEYVKTRFTEFLDSVLEQMDYIMTYKEDKVMKLEENQKALEERLNRVQNIVDNIEKDIYSEEGFDFEIVCPYCNYEFVIDVDENRTEIECPECQNTIELDWSGNPDEEDGCSGHCSHCHGCEDEEDNDEDM